MASLIEELISTLTKEKEIYEKVLPISRKKTQVIVKNDLEGLQEITALEQEMLDTINALEHKREEVIRNISTVLSKDAGTLNVKEIIKILDGQPEEQRSLGKIHDSLIVVIQTLMEINNQNESLINQSLDMIEFNMNFIQSTRMSPGNNNYTKGAGEANAQAMQTGMFDAKQ